MGEVAKEGFKLIGKILVILGIIGLIIFVMNMPTVHATGLTDVMKDFSNNNTPDQDKMEAGTSLIVGFFGTLTSAGILILFSASMLTTVVDLLYIGVPGLRTVLYNKSAQGINNGNTNNIPNSIGQQSANAWLNKGKTNTNSNSVASTESTRCLISSELKSLDTAGAFNKTTSGTILTQYLKIRVKAIILLAICIVLLTSSIFTDCGINVGQFIFKYIFRFASMQ